jgi:hypothetical protein
LLKDALEKIRTTLSLNCLYKRILKLDRSFVLEVTNIFYKYENPKRERKNLERFWAHFILVSERCKGLDEKLDYK